MTYGREGRSDMIYQLTCMRNALVNQAVYNLNLIGIHSNFPMN